MPDPKRPEVPTLFDDFDRFRGIAEGFKFVGTESIDSIRIDEALRPGARRQISKSLGVPISELPDTMSLDALIAAGVKPKHFIKPVRKDLLELGFAESGKQFASPEKIKQLTEGTGPPGAADFRDLAAQQAMGMIAFDPFSEEGAQHPATKAFSAETSRRFRESLSPFAPQTGVRALDEANQVITGLVNLDLALQDAGMRQLGLVAPELIPEFVFGRMDMRFNRQNFQHLFEEMQEEQQKARKMLHGDRAQFRKHAFEQIPNLHGGGGGGGGGGGLISSLL